MFILRRIQSGIFESNECLGNKYYLMNRSNYENFDGLLDDYVPHSPAKSEIYALIQGEEKQAWIPLYKDDIHYIMTGDGKTFSNITSNDLYLKVRNAKRRSYSNSSKEGSPGKEQ